MTPTRALTLFATLSTLLLAACSQDEVRTQTLAPQFGETTPGTDAAEHMAASTGGVYLGGRWNDRPALIKFGRSGNIPWVKTLPGNASVSEVAASPGSAHVVYSLEGADGSRSFFVRSYSQTGGTLWTRGLASGVEASNTNATAATDKNGNLYLATSFGSVESGQAELRKYRSDGTLVWRKRGAAYIYDLDASANGFVHTVAYISDAQVLTRYKPDGGLLWRAPVPYDLETQAVAVGREGEIYVASNDERYPHQLFTTLAKYDSRGTRVWERAVQDSIGLHLDGMDADSQGNAFLALTHPDFGEDQPNRSKEFYAYSPGGKRLLYRAFDFGSEQTLVGPAALAPTEVYMAASGVGAANRDGLLVRLDGLTGNVTWQR